MSAIEVHEESIEHLAEHARVSIAYEADRVFELELRDAGLGGIVLTERPLPSPRRKDYDALPGNEPARWPERFDVSSWGLLAARQDGERVGGALIAGRTPDLRLLGGRDDLALLWDLRVAPEHRGSGVGTLLFEAAERWARARGYRQLGVETQNTNPAACRFYARRGCTLGAVNRFAYPDEPDEVQLLWFKEL